LQPSWNPERIAQETKTSQAAVTYWNKASSDQLWDGELFTIPRHLWSPERAWIMYIGIFLLQYLVFELRAYTLNHSPALFCDEFFSR
jgi:hypothetical protein